jgi:hypothetical protein
MTTPLWLDTNTTRTSNTRRSLVRGAIAAGLAAAAMALTGPVAHADVKSDCTKAGGTHTTQGSSVETCCYKEAINTQGHHCKVYIAGDFSGTHFEQPPVPTKPAAVPPKVADQGVAPVPPKPGSPPPVAVAPRG